MCSELVEGRSEINAQNREVVEIKDEVADTAREESYGYVLHDVSDRNCGRRS